MKQSTKEAQTKRTFEAFHGEPKTMMQVSVETRILRPNICRYINKWEEQGKIIKLREGICPITKHNAGFYSTHPTYFPTETHPELFPPTTKSRAYSR